jgi:hypothetical protein
LSFEFWVLGFERERERKSASGVRIVMDVELHVKARIEPLIRSETRSQPGGGWNRPVKEFRPLACRLGELRARSAAS